MRMILLAAITVLTSIVGSQSAHSQQNPITVPMTATFRPQTNCFTASGGIKLRYWNVNFEPAGFLFDPTYPSSHQLQMPGKSTFGPILMSQTISAVDPLLCGPGNYTWMQETQLYDWALRNSNTGAFYGALITCGAGYGAPSVHRLIPFRNTVQNSGWDYPNALTLTSAEPCPN